MNILLINPPALSMFSSFGMSLPPMGLLYIAAALENSGHQVVIRDLTVEDVTVSNTDITNASLVGISSDTTRIDKALALARQASTLGVPVVMGGPHPQFLAKEILASGYVNYIVRGEGEPVLAELADTMEQGKDPAIVNGLIYLDQNGQIRETPDAVKPDVEELPLPARHLLDLKSYTGYVAGRPAAPVITSRGCPGACHFCSSSSFFGRGWRARSAASVLAEIDLLYNEYGYRAIAFMDDNFTLLPERVCQIADGLIQRGYDLKLWNFSRVDSIVRNPQMVAKMAAAGCFMVYLGIESEDRDTLNSLGKRSTAEDAAEAVRMLKANGIEVYGSYIIGNLNEGAEEIRRTVDMAISLDTQVAQFSILTPYPGTQLYQKLKDRINTHKWKFFDGLHLVFRHPVLGRIHLQLLLAFAFIRYYRRSETAKQGFRQASSKCGMSFRKVASCALEMLK